MAKDNTIGGIDSRENSLGASGKGLSKTLEELAREKTALTAHNKELGDAYKKLSVDVEVANRKVRSAGERFRTVGDEASKLKLEEAYGDLRLAQEALSGCSAQMSKVTKGIQEISNEENRRMNRMSMTGVEAWKDSFSTWRDSLDEKAVSKFKTDMAKQFGEAAINGIGAHVGSAHGESAGKMTTSVLSGALSGGLAGAALGPAGIAIGAVIGGVSGLINGMAEDFKKKDDLFKALRNGMVENAWKQAPDISFLTAGLPRYLEQEQVRSAYTRWIGDEEKADRLIEQAQTIAVHTPFSADRLLELDTTLQDKGYTESAARVERERIVDTGTALGWGDAQMQQVAYLLGDMKQGNLTREHMDLLEATGLDVYGYMASLLSRVEGTDLTKQDVADRVDAGKIDGQYANWAISEAMSSDFAGAAADFAESAMGVGMALKQLEETLQADIAGDYLAGSKEGMQKQADWYAGEGHEIDRDIAKVQSEELIRRQDGKAQIERDVKTAMHTGSLDNLEGEYSEQQLGYMQRLIDGYSSDDGRERYEAVNNLNAVMDHIYKVQYEADSMIAMTGSIGFATEMMQGEDAYFQAVLAYNNEKTKGMGSVTGKSDTSAEIYRETIFAGGIDPTAYVPLERTTEERLDDPDFLFDNPGFHRPGTLGEISQRHASDNSAAEDSAASRSEEQPKRLFEGWFGSLFGKRDGGVESPASIPGKPSFGEAGRSIFEDGSPAQQAPNTNVAHLSATGGSGPAGTLSAHTVILSGKELQSDSIFGMEADKEPYGPILPLASNVYQLPGLDGALPEGNYQIQQSWSPTVTIDGTFHIREEADIYKLAEEVIRRMNIADMLSVPDQAI